MIDSELIQCAIELQNLIETVQPKERNNKIGRIRNLCGYTERHHLIQLLIELEESGRHPENYECQQFRKDPTPEILDFYQSQDSFINFQRVSSYLKTQAGDPIKISTLYCSINGMVYEINYEGPALYEVIYKNSYIECLDEEYILRPLPNKKMDAGWLHERCSPEHVALYNTWKEEFNLLLSRHILSIALPASEKQTAAPRARFKL